jgi:hypothetical protein
VCARVHSFLSINHRRVQAIEIISRFSIETVLLSQSLLLFMTVCSIADACRSG